MLDRDFHARLSLLALLIILLLGISVSTGRFGQIRSDRQRTSDAPIATADFGSGVRSEDRVVTQLMARIRERPLTAAEFELLFDVLKDSTWHSARSLVHAVHQHHQPRDDEVRLWLLQRAARSASSGELASLSTLEWLACIQLIRETLDEGASSELTAHREWDSISACLVALAEHCEDGSVRSQALRILARRPPNDWQPLVLKALDAPSLKVCTTALEIAENSNWKSAMPRLVELSSSAWPELRAASTRAIETLGGSADPEEYGDCVVAAASKVADDLARSGADYDVLANTLSLPIGGPIDMDLIKRSAESYLDQSGPGDGRGVLWLAIAAYAKQRKLMLRIWEHEIDRADSNAELLESGLEIVARTQLIDGMSALRDGNRTSGLRRLAEVARILPTSPHSRIHIYARQAGQLSQAAWQDPARQPSGTVARDSVTEVAARVLGNFDLSIPEQRRGAEQNVDRWCGLEPIDRPTTGGARYQPMAN